MFTRDKDTSEMIDRQAVGTKTYCLDAPVTPEGTSQVDIEALTSVAGWYWLHYNFILLLK